MREYYSPGVRYMMEIEEGCDSPYLVVEGEEGDNDVQ
jgi:hypothetical protein